MESLRDGSNYVTVGLDKEDAREINIKGVSTKVIQVPYIPQNKDDNNRYVRSLLMTLEYFRNFYKDPKVRHETPKLSLDDVINITETTEFGTSYDSLIKNLDK